MPSARTLAAAAGHPRHDGGGGGAVGPHAAHKPGKVAGA